MIRPGGGWAVFETDENGLHVIPLDDLRDHVASAKCRCAPFIEGPCWVHNSGDKREELERGIRRPS